MANQVAKGKQMEGIKDEWVEIEGELYMVRPAVYREIVGLREALAVAVRQRDYHQDLHRALEGKNG